MFQYKVGLNRTLTLTEH